MSLYLQVSKLRKTDHYGSRLLKDIYNEKALISFIKKYLFNLCTKLGINFFDFKEEKLMVLTYVVTCFGSDICTLGIRF